MEKQNTLQDVALAAGVGIGTVSRALNNSPSVHPDTAAEIRAAVARLGYQLPANGRKRGPRATENGKSLLPGGKIMLAVLGNQGLAWILHYAPVYVGVIHGIETATAERGCRLHICQAATRMELSQILKNTSPTGLIIIGFEDSDTPPETAGALRRIPAVWTMGSPQNFQGDHIQPDHIHIGEIAARHALRQGHRECAIIGTHRGSAFRQMNLRNEAFRWAVEEAGGRVLSLLDPNIVRRGSQEHEIDTRLVRRLVDQIAHARPRPTALFLENDMLAPVAYQSLRATGLEPQVDIEIISCNNELPYLSALDARPTTVDIQPQVIGRRAVDQLLWRLDNLQAPPLKLLVEPVLVVHPAERPQLAIAEK